MLVVWAFYELRTTDPLCDLRVTAQRPVLLTNLAAVAVGFGMMAQAIVVPQLLQIPKATGFGLGQTMLEAGLWMAPGGLMMLVFAPVSSRLMTRIGPKLTLMIGAGVLGVGYLVARELMDAPWQLLVASCVASAGVGIGYAAMPTLILDSVPMTEAASAVGINGLMRSVGTSVAAAVMAALLTSSTTQIGSFELPTQGAFQLCFVVGAAAAFLGVAIAATIPVVRRREQEREVVTATPPEARLTSGQLAVRLCGSSRRPSSGCRPSAVCRRKLRMPVDARAAHHAHGPRRVVAGQGPPLELEVGGARARGRPARPAGSSRGRAACSSSRLIRSPYGTIRRARASSLDRTGEGDLDDGQPALARGRQRRRAVCSSSIRRGDR